STGSSAQRQKRVPPVNPSEPGAMPLSMAGWMASCMAYSGCAVVHDEGAAAPRSPVYACSGALAAPPAWPCLVADHRADHLALVHEVERVVDLLQRQLGRDELVDPELAGHVALDIPRQLRASLDAAEGRPAPHAP